MSVLFLTQASSGAPALTPANGSMAAVLDWAMAQKSWATEYSSGNARVYRPASGIRNRLFIGDDSTISGSAQLCTFNGSENATAAASASLTDPFPAVSNAANSILKSTVATLTARNYEILISETWIWIAVNADGASGWDHVFFGDFIPTHNQTDPYASVCISRGSSTTTGARGNALNTAIQSNTATAGYAVMRSLDGSVKASRGSLYGLGVTSGVVAASLYVAGEGTTYGLDIIRAQMNDLGSATATVSASLAMPQRGVIPNLWIGRSIGQTTISVQTNYRMSGYDPAALFRFYPLGTPSVSAGWVILEITDTFKVPV